MRWRREGTKRGNSRGSSTGLERVSNHSLGDTDQLYRCSEHCQLEQTARCISLATCDCRHPTPRLSPRLDHLPEFCHKSGKLVSRPALDCFDEYFALGMQSSRPQAGSVHLFASKFDICSLTFLRVGSNWRLPQRVSRPPKRCAVHGVGTTRFF